MITNSRQSWQIGSTVKVGFLTLTVLAAVPTPGDYAADAYLLSNLAGDRLYRFVPHKGCERITADDAAAQFAGAASGSNRTPVTTTSDAQEHAERWAEFSAAIA